MRKIFVLAVPLLVAGVMLFGLDTTENQITKNDTPTPGDDFESSSQDIDADTDADLLPTVQHERSLPALMRRDFRGQNLELGDVLAQNETYTRYAITYESGALTISGIMNIPNGDGPFPLVVLNHGYIDPAVYTRGRGLKREQDYFARNGYVVIHSDYRNHAFSDEDPDNENSMRLDYMIDVINAILAVQSADLPAVDATRVGMMGHSMGGGIAQNIAVVKPDLVDAIVLYAPVSGDYYENFLEYVVDDDDEDDGRGEEILEQYGTPEETPTFWEGVSAKTYYDRVASPVMIHIGTVDDSTPPVWSQQMNDRLQEAGKDVVLHVYDGERHEFGPQWETMMSRSLDFFETHVDSNP